MRSYTEQVTFWLTNDSKSFLLLFALLVVAAGLAAAAAAADGITLNGVIRFSDTECPLFQSQTIVVMDKNVCIYISWMVGQTDGIRITM